MQIGLCRYIITGPSPVRLAERVRRLLSYLSGTGSIPDRRFKSRDLGHTYALLMRGNNLETRVQCWLISEKFTIIPLH